MMGRIAIVVGAVVSLLTIPHAVSSQTTDPWIGTWKLNLAKSTYKPGPAPKSNTLTIEPAPGGAAKHTFDGINADGQTIHSERVGKFDGSDTPVHAMQPAATGVLTNTFTRIDGRSFEAANKTDGKVTTTTRVVISADGKTMMHTVTGTNARGQAVNNALVWDKQ